MCKDCEFEPVCVKGVLVYLAGSLAEGDCKEEVYFLNAGPHADLW